MRRAWLQLTAALLAVFGGAWLIGLWAVGVVLVLAGAALAADLMLSDTERWEKPSGGGTHADVLERWRRAR